MNVDLGDTAIEFKRCEFILFLLSLYIYKALYKKTVYLIYLFLPLYIIYTMSS